jgi:hypothetical protein
MNFAEKHYWKSKIYKNYFWNSYSFQSFPADKNRRLSGIAIQRIHLAFGFPSPLVSMRLINVFLR